MDAIFYGFGIILIPNSYTPTNHLILLNIFQSLFFFLLSFGLTSVRKHQMKMQILAQQLSISFTFFFRYQNYIQEMIKNKFVFCLFPCVDCIQFFFFLVLYSILYLIFYSVCIFITTNTLLTSVQFENQYQFICLIVDLFVFRLFCFSFFFFFFESLESLYIMLEISREISQQHLKSQYRLSTNNSIVNKKKKSPYSVSYPISV